VGLRLLRPSRGLGDLNRPSYIGYASDGAAMTQKQAIAEMRLGFDVAIEDGALPA
jgi:hypothetical protein